MLIVFVFVIKLSLENKKNSCIFNISNGTNIITEDLNSIMIE